jgi:hypothetical protein
LIDKDDLTNLQQTIKEDMSKWLATSRRYDDLAIEDIW